MKVFETACLFTKDFYLESGKWWAEPGQTIHTHPITQRKKGTVTPEIGFILGSTVYDKYCPIVSSSSRTAIHITTNVFQKPFPCRTSSFLNIGTKLENNSVFFRKIRQILVRILQKCKEKV